MENGRLFGDLFDVIRRNFILLLVIVIVSAIAGIIFSSPAFMKPRFKSTAVVYPINIIPHSEESETEQMLQLFGHEGIKESVLETFELYNRWDDLKPGEPEFRHWSNLLYEERVSISPTKYESIEITCQDEDPVIARDMVLHIIDKYNWVTRMGDRYVHEEYLKLKDFEIEQFNHLLDSLENRVQTIRIEHGVTDFQAQSESLSEVYYELLASGASESRLSKVKKEMEALAAAGSELGILTARIEELEPFYRKLAEGKVMATSKAKSQLEYCKVIVEPKVADKKTFPIRWIILLLSVLVGAFSALVIIVAKERAFSRS